MINKNRTGKATDSPFIIPVGQNALGTAACVKSILEAVTLTRPMVSDLCPVS